MVARTGLLAFVCTAMLAGCGRSDEAVAESAQDSTPRGALQLTSPAFGNGSALPIEFTCDGPGRSPPLQWSQPPTATQSFALVVDDPDAPDGTFGHWGVYDLPPSTRQINTGAAETAASRMNQTGNDFGSAGYGAPCPPKGSKPHRYRFRLLALDVAELRVPPAKPDDLFALATGHVLASAELTATYSRR